MLQHPRSGPLICNRDIPHNIALISISVLGVTDTTSPKLA